MPTDHSARQGGVALVLVLWMLVLLTVIANSMVFSLRAEVLGAAGQVSFARAEAAAEAAVFRVMWELTRPQTDTTRWQGDGMIHEWLFDDIRLQVTIIDEAGKIDLNAASAELLRGLFQSVGVDAEASLNLADAVIDWHDADDLRQVHGAEKDDYVAAGRDYVPRNGRMESIEELRWVLGMNEEIFRRVESLVTVYSARPGVASSVAPRGVLLALPNVNPEKVDAYLLERQAQQLAGLPVAEAPFAGAYASGGTQDTFTIQVKVNFGDNTPQMNSPNLATYSRTAIVMVTGKSDNPVAILAWRSP